MSKTGQDQKVVTELIKKTQTQRNLRMKILNKNLSGKPH